MLEYVEIKQQFDVLGPETHQTEIFLFIRSRVQTFTLCLSSCEHTHEVYTPVFTNTTQCHKLKYACYTINVVLIVCRYFLVALIV